MDFPTQDTMGSLQGMYGEIPEVVMSPLSLKERMLKSSARFLANVFEALAILAFASCSAAEVRM